jgi:predicted alpha/beta-fold hydrolase
MNNGVVMMSTSNKFKPAWWLPGPHLQTLWPTLCRRAIKDIPLEHERFELPDGDFLDLSWVGREKEGPIVLILHGLEGSLHSPYAQGMLSAVHQQNWRGLLMHFRGCSGEPNRLARSYHSGETKDLNTLITALHEREPDTLLAAVGFSLGGNVLLKWLGETSKQSMLTVASAVSVPFELHKSANRIQQGFSRLYQRHFLKCLSKRLADKFQNQPSPIELPHFSELKSMWEFDDKVTAPLHGFSGVDDYYTQSSSRQYLRTINVPTLLVQSKDDPFMTPDIIPHQDELSEYIKLEVTETGGHVGFVTGTVPWRAQYWLEQRIPLFLQEYLMKV